MIHTHLHRTQARIILQARHTETYTTATIANVSICMDLLAPSRRSNQAPRHHRAGHECDQASGRLSPRPHTAQTHAISFWLYNLVDARQERVWSDASNMDHRRQLPAHGGRIHLCARK